MHFRQSFSKSAGTPVVLNHNSIDTSFFKQYASPPAAPSPINVCLRIRIELRIKSEENRVHANIQKGAGGRTLFQINGFWAMCPNTSENDCRSFSRLDSLIVVFAHLNSLTPNSSKPLAHAGYFCLLLFCFATSLQ